MIIDSVDREILSLFPSLNFNRLNVNKNAKKRMKRYLKVLKKTAENGSITKYTLTKWNASPRLGGQSAQEALVELEELDLLKSERTTSKKGTLRINRSLTPKGIIACMALPEFQQIDQLNKILEKSYYKDSKLASTLRLYNNKFVRRTNLTEYPISPATVIVKEVVIRGFNFELKSENSIAQELRNIEEAGFIESLKLNPFLIYSSFILSLENEKFRHYLKYLINEVPKRKLDFKTVHQIERTIQAMILFFTSPEVLASVSLIEKSKLNPEKLIEIVDRQIIESKIKFKDDVERFEYALKTIREIITSKY